MKKLLTCLSIFISTFVFAQAPANNTCNVTSPLLVSGPICATTTGTIVNATLDGGTACPGTERYDVWYRFVAQTPNPTITLSNLGANFTSPGLQVLSGCGGTSIICGTTSVNPTTLTIGNTYYIRVFSTTATALAPTTLGNFDICITDPMVTSGRMNEVFLQTLLSPASVLNYPWEVTYGPDNKLWVSEARGYKVYRIDPATGTKTTVLDLSTGSTFLPSPSDSLNAVNMGTWSPWPQGGFAGLALHPKFLDGTGLHDFVYVAYVHRFLGGTSPSGLFYRNKLVRFTYNNGTGLLESPAVLCDTLPGSKDHNSQRMIIAPVSSTPGATNYLFYGSGDMGSGQFENRTRAMKAQITSSYEGKILRFNLDTTGQPGPNKWIPNDNPYSSNSAVYSIGIRNNQGFAYDTALNILFGSSHGPFSDDEINVIRAGKNYGHPFVIGFAADGNYNSITAGSAPNMSGGSTSTCPPIANEAIAASTIGTSYKDPIFSAYTTPTPVSPSNYTTVNQLWNNTTGTNNIWPSEGWSGLDLYTNKIIPGWKKSLVASGLKWGRLIRLKLGATDTTTLPSNLGYGNTGDTVTYFQSTNRYRDLAFAPNGKDIYVIMDNSSATSGPGVGNPITPACPGCLVKYTFLGYSDVSGKSSIDTSIGVTDGSLSACNTGTTVTIDDTNNLLWVPITGPDGNIMAEIYANGNNLGTVTSSFYQRTGPSRMANGKPYLNRNIRITPLNPPGSAVKIRLYISKAEYDTLDHHPLSLVSAITDVKILKNNDACGSAIASSTSPVTMLFEEAHGTNGYMLQGSITSFSSFYFGSTSITLPLQLLTFKGSLQNNATRLSWETANEANVSHFAVERSIDNRNFSAIGTVSANGNNTANSKYSFTDNDVTNQSSSVVYYRLKMVDVDGNYTYSSVVTITLPYITGKITVFPNPATHEIKLTIGTPADGKVHYSLADNTGRIVIRNSSFVRRGNNIITIKIDKLTAGFYYLSVSGDGINQKVKLEKL